MECRRRSIGQPFLWFPWDGPFSAADVQRTIEGEINLIRTKDPTYPVPSAESLRRVYTPDAIVESGDRIEIDHVVIEGETSGLHHEHDVQLRLAYVRIVNPSGQMKLLEEPIVFTGASAAWTGGYSKMLSKINQRLCTHFKLESLHDPAGIEFAKRGALAEAEAGQGRGNVRRGKRRAADAESALHHAAVLARADLSALLDEYARQSTSSKDRALVRARIKHMIDEACLVGYRWARAEADLHMKPLAEGGLRSRSAAPKGGRESGVARRQKAENTWHPRALEWAQEQRRANPAATKEEIVAAMEEHARKAKVRLPGERTLRPFLVKMEGSGKLAAKRKTAPLSGQKRK